MPKVETMSAQRAREEFSRLLSYAEFRGTEVIITRQGKPVAKLIPYTEETTETTGSQR